MIYETSGKVLEILVFTSQGGAGTLEKGPRGTIFPGIFLEIENLKGCHISSRISGNVRQGQCETAFLNWAVQEIARGLTGEHADV